MGRMSITAKIWASIGVFVAGTLVAVGIGQVQAVIGEGRLQHTSAVLFPAAQNGQDAETAFENMAKGFGDAVLLEDASALDHAKLNGETAADLIDKTAVLFAAEADRAAKLRTIGADVRGLVKDGLAAYVPVIAAAGNLTPELMGPVQQVAPRLDALKKTLAEQRQTLICRTSWRRPCSGRPPSAGCRWACSSRR
jgi:hypothetical protein